MINSFVRFERAWGEAACSSFAVKACNTSLAESLGCAWSCCAGRCICGCTPTRPGLALLWVARQFLGWPPARFGMVARQSAPPLSGRPSVFGLVSPNFRVGRPPVLGLVARQIWDGRHDGLEQNRLLTIINISMNIIIDKIIINIHIYD